MSVNNKKFFAELSNNPQEIMRHLATRAKALRLEANLTQSGLANRSGVSLGSIKRFEKLGEISLKSLLSISLVLRRLSDFDNVFKESDVPESLFKEKPKKQRQRGRRE